MNHEDVRASFASRVHELCDELKIAPGHGRQTALGKMFGVTPKAARKWLLGISYPEMALAVTMCNAAGVNVLWLLQGSGPKKGDKVDRPSMLLAEGLQGLPADKRLAVLDYIRFQFGQADGWFTHEAMARYMDSVDTLRQRDANSRGAPIKTSRQ